VQYDLGAWHEIAVKGQDGHLQVWVDGTLHIDYFDVDPLMRGYIAFETVEGSYTYVDDVVLIVPEEEVD